MNFISRFDGKAFVGIALPALSGQGFAIGATLLSGATLHKNFWYMQGAYVLFFILLSLATSYFCRSKERRATS